jgi:WD40 repeat protein
MNKRAYLILFLIFALSVRVTEGQDSPPPYLYYYSSSLNAFVIERADGTDSRILGRGITPHDELAYPAPGWSPSGKWFVWTSAIPTEDGGYIRFHRWGVSADGTQRITLLDNISDVPSIAWSPADDLLFLIEARNSRMSLIDVPADRMVTSIETKIDDYDLSSVSWTPDGQYATFYYGTYPGNDFTRQREEFLRLVSREGEVVDRQISVLGYEEIYRTHPLYSSLGWLLYGTPDKTNLVAENLTMGQKVEFDAPPGDVHQIEWSPSGNYAALFIWTRCDTVSDCPYSLWLMSLSTQRLEKVAENIYHQFGYDESVFWSSRQDIGAFMTSDGIVHLLEAEAGGVTDLELPVNDPLNLELPANPRLYWFPSGDRLLIPGMKDNERQRTFAYEYNLTTKRTLIWDFDGNTPLISADGDYIAGLWSEPTIFTSFGHRRILLPRHSGTYFWENQVALYYASWHPIEDWLLTGVAHDPFSPHMPRSVTNAQGTFQRELGNCLCVAWLPAQVNVTDLPRGSPDSVIPAPELTFDTGAWVEGLSWSPDGKRLAVGHYSFMANNDGQIGIQEWDLSGQEPDLLFTILVPKDTRLGWQHSQDDTYVLLPDESGNKIELLTIDVDWQRQVPAFSPNRTLSVRRDENRQPAVWDEARGQFLYTLSFLPNSRSDAIFSTTFSPDGRLIAGNGPYLQVHIWATATGNLLTALNVFSNAIAFSPDGKWLATGMANNVALWDMAAVIAGANS